MKYLNKQKNDGFTLIETLVAISVLTIAVVTPLYMVSKSLYLAAEAKERFIATNLAQEAVELVRAKRDSNFLKIMNTGSGGWLDDIPTEKDFVVDTKTGTMIECLSGSTGGNGCQYLKLYGDEGDLTRLMYYGQASPGGTQTQFKRFVRITKNDNGDTETSANIHVEVKWQTFGYIERSIAVDETMYNWLR